MMAEKELQAAVNDLATRFDWLTYHTNRSDRSEPGFPDLNMVRGPRLIYAELKTGTGKLSAPQMVWLTKLALSGRCEVYLWRPEHLPILGTLLSKKHYQPQMLGGIGKFTVEQVGRWDPS